ncbi:hypothetical protein C5167_005015 [Papaver somniferum]|uniref:Cytochrome P450 n=1 Tax=Papaver somniferum TaxID=3469 RepID=A0A4Y7JCD6_PAPSO|nr:hypothetical protein C5167_005015 [Papaver somniferum]
MQRSLFRHLFSVNGNHLNVSHLRHEQGCAPQSPSFVGRFHKLTAEASDQEDKLITDAKSRSYLESWRINETSWAEFSNKTLVVSSAEMAKEIMKNQDLVFPNKPSSTAANALFYGCTDIGFAPYGEYWRQVRKICVLELLNAKRVHSFKNVREEEVDTVIQKISSSCSSMEEGEVVINLSKVLLTLTNNIVSRCAIGAKYESAHENKSGELSREISRLLGAFSFGDYFPSLGWMDVVIGLSSKLKKVSQELDAFFNQVIDEHLLGQVRDVDKLDLTDILLLSKKDNPNITRNNIKSIILDMLAGGTDTTATIMEWAMAELIKNPKVMQIAQDEVRRVVGNKHKLEQEVIKSGLSDHADLVAKAILRRSNP